MRYRVVEVEGKFYPQWKKNVIAPWQNISRLSAVLAGCNNVNLGSRPWQTPADQTSLEDAIEICQRVEEHNKPKKKPVERVVWRS